MWLAPYVTVNSRSIFGIRPLASWVNHIQFHMVVCVMLRTDGRRNLCRRPSRVVEPGKAWNHYFVFSSFCRELLNVIGKMTLRGNSDFALCCGIFLVCLEFEHILCLNGICERADGSSWLNSTVDWVEMAIQLPHYLRQMRYFLRSVVVFSISLFLFLQNWTELPTYVKQLHDQSMHAILIFDPAIQVDSESFQRGINAVLFTTFNNSFCAAQRILH